MSEGVSTLSQPNFSPQIRSLMRMGHTAADSVRFNHLTVYALIIPLKHEDHLLDLPSQHQQLVVQVHRAAGGDGPDALGLPVGGHP